MPLTVTMPQLGESVTEGTIARWLKQPGDAIAKYKSIAEVITDKVNAEIPAPADGVMAQVIAPEGTVVPVGQPICSIETSVPASASDAPSATASVASAPAQAEPSAPATPPAMSPPQISLNLSVCCAAASRRSRLRRHRGGGGARRERSTAGLGRSSGFPC